MNLTITLIIIALVNVASCVVNMLIFMEQRAQRRERLTGQGVTSR